MLTSKIRITIASAIAVAALTTPGAASAALLVRSPVTVPPVHVSPPKPVAMEVGSAGISGYDDAKCEDLVKDMENARYYAEGYSGEGNKKAAESYEEQAKKVQHQIEDNCLIVD